MRQDNFQALIKIAIAVMDRATPIQFRADRRSLKKTKAEKIDRPTMAILFMPKTMELSKIWLFKVLIDIDEFP